MKYQGRGVYKNTDIGDVLATDSEANEAISHGHFIEIGRGEDSYFVIETQNAEAHASASASDGLTGSIPDEVRLWIAKVRDRLEHIHRSPITQKDGHALLRESIDIAQRYNCYESPRTPCSANHFCEESCGIASAASCPRWRDCYADALPHVIRQIEERISQNDMLTVSGGREKTI